MVNNMRLFGSFRKPGVEPAVIIPGYEYACEQDCPTRQKAAVLGVDAEQLCIEQKERITTMLAKLGCLPPTPETICGGDESDALYTAMATAETGEQNA